MPVRRLPGAAGSAAGRREAPGAGSDHRRRCAPRPRRGCGLVPSRARPGRGAPSPSRQGNDAEGSWAWSSRPGAISKPCRPRTVGYHPRPDSPEPGGAARQRAHGVCVRRRMPGPRPGGVIGERARGCAWGVRSRRNARCATPDSPADRSAVRWPRAAGAHGACGRARLTGAGGSAHEAVHEGLPGAHGACAQAELPLHGNGLPNRPTTDASGGARQGADGWARSEAAARCVAAAPRLDRKGVCRWWSARVRMGRALKTGCLLCVNGFSDQPRAKRWCRAARCAWGVRSAPVPGAGGGVHEAVHGGSRVIMGRALRPDARYAATNSLVDRSMPAAGARQGAHAACARRRPFVAWRLSRASTEEACAGGGARRCAWGVRSGRIPVTRQRISQSTEGRASGEERPGDHGACGRVGTPGAGGAHEGVSGSFQVIMGRALRAARPSRCNGFSRRSEGGRGRARQRGRPGGAGGRHGVRGDHGACAQGRIPVTRQRIPSNRRAPCARENGRVIMGCAVRPERPGPTDATEVSCGG